MELERRGEKRAKIEEIKNFENKCTNPRDDSIHMMIIEEFQDLIGCIGQAKD